MAKRAWVIGARGFLGRSVAKCMSENGWEVSGFGRGEFLEHRRWGLRKWFPGSVSREGLERLAATEGHPALVFHAAGSSTVGSATSDPAAAYIDTVVSAVTVLEFLAERAPAAIFLYPSSCAVYGEVEQLPIPETEPVHPLSVYGEHKAEVEQVCREMVDSAGLTCGIIRYFSVYGPGLRKQLLWDVSTRLAAGERELRLGGTGDEVRDLLHIDDAVHIALAMENAIAPHTLLTVNGGSGAAVSVRQIVNRLVERLAPDAVVTFTGEVRSGNPSRLEADIRELTKIYRPIWSWAEGVDDYASWAAGATAIPG